MKTRVLVMLALGCAMALMLTACTKKTENNVESKTAAAEVVTESEKEPAATETAAEPVQEAQSIVIESGDFDGIQKLGSDMQNFAVAEGTEIKVTGIWVKNGSTPAVMETNEAGDQKKGISMYFDYDQEDLADSTAIEVTGKAVKGTYFMEFHIAEGGLKVLD